MSKPFPVKRKKVGPFSKRLSFAALDRRTLEGRFAAATVEALYDQMGKTPTAGQQIIAQQIAVKLLRCEKLMPKIMSGDFDAPHPANMYLAWSNAIRRDLEALGLLADAPTLPPRSLADIAREIEQEAAD